MLSAVSAADVALRNALREQSHCVPNDLIIKERLEGPFEIPYLALASFASRFRVVRVVRGSEDLEDEPEEVKKEVCYAQC
jgi:hypothetical protein